MITTLQAALRDNVTGPFDIKLKRAQQFDHSRKLAWFAHLVGVGHGTRKDGSTFTYEHLLNVAVHSNRAVARRAMEGEMAELNAHFGVQA